jgi:hypothetical protein
MRCSILIYLALSAISTAVAQTSEEQTLVVDLPGVPTVVNLELFVVDVFSISNVDQSYKVDLYVAASWNDPRLVGSSTRVLPTEDVWTPNLTIVNTRAAELLLPDVVRVGPDGEVYGTQRFIGELSARMDLREFPHDSQVLPIQVISLDYSPEEIEMRAVDGNTRGFEEFSVSGWDLTLGSASPKPLMIPGSGRLVPQVVFEIDAKREVEYYNWTMYLPLSLGLSTAAIFTLIAFRFSIGLMLPAVSYMTRLDQFLLGCTILVFFALGQAVIVGRLFGMDLKPKAHALSVWSRWIYLAGFIALAAVYL